MPGEGTRGLVDAKIPILRAAIDAGQLPDEVAISAVTLGELVAGVHLVVGDDEESRAERNRRLDLLLWAEREFDPLPYDAEAARLYGRIVAATAAVGRTSRRRTADLMIAAIAGAGRLPLYTTNPRDFAALTGIVDVVPVARPALAR